jgi:hypothetical protein
LSPGCTRPVELYVRNASGIQVGKNRDRWKPPLYIFEITGGDAERRLQPVSIKWFISGKGGSDIVKWYADKFRRGTRLVVYGLWDQDNRGQMFLKIAKPDEIEILPPVAGSEDFGLLKESSPETTRRRRREHFRSVAVHHPHRQSPDLSQARAVPDETLARDRAQRSHESQPEVRRRCAA